MPIRTELFIDQKPLVSIIIPTYNNAQFLPAAINSVLAQSYDSYEMIVVDDGSTDDTPSVLRPFQQHIRYISQENQGSAVARNTGLALAKGEFVVFLDADDLLLPDKLQLQVEYLLNNPALGMVHSGWQLIDEAGNEIRQVTPWEKAPVLNLEAWLWKKPIKMGAMMYRRHWLRYVQGFDPELRQSQDTDLMIRLALAGCTAEWLKQPTMAYRVYSESTIRRNAPKQHRYLLKVHQKAFAHPNMPDYLHEKKERMQYFSLRWAVWHIFDAGFPDDVVEPLTIMREISPYSADDTLFDVLIYLAQQLRKKQRPYTALHSLKSPLLSVLDCCETTWQHVFALFEAIFGQEPPLTFDEPHTVWWFWQTAVSRQEETAVDVEAYLMCWLAVWRPYLREGNQIPEPLLQRVQALSPDDFCAIGRLCLVENSEAYSLAEIEKIWRVAEASGLVPAPYPAGYVSWLLTTFGQTALRGRYGMAGKALLQATGRTLRNPTAVRAWTQFLKTAVAYYQKKSSEKAR